MLDAIHSSICLEINLNKYNDVILFQAMYRYVWIYGEISHICVCMYLRINENVRWSIGNVRNRLHCGLMNTPDNAGHFFTKYRNKFNILYIYKLRCLLPLMGKAVYLLRCGLKGYE